MISPIEYDRIQKPLYSFQVDGITLGSMPDWVVKKFDWSNGWNVDHVHGSVSLVTDHSEPDPVARRSAIMATTLQEARESGLFAVLKGWRNELYPVYGSNRELLVNIERSGSNLFGVVTYGVHMTGYVKNDSGIRIWVPRRAADKQTYGGMLDNTVAGGISSGEDPFECLVRECEEEASLPEQLVRRGATAAGTVTYFYVRDERAGGETGLLQPECQYVYDLEMPEDVVPKPGDNEAEDFQLWTVEKTQQALKEGRFKPNCALVMLDFFVRHGILNQGNERDYIEIVARLHRRLDYPTA